MCQYVIVHFRIMLIGWISIFNLPVTMRAVFMRSSISCDCIRAAFDPFPIFGWCANGVASVERREIFPKGNYSRLQNETLSTEAGIEST